MELQRLGTLGPVRWPRPVVAVGNFDGVHRGHQAPIAATVAQARDRAGTAAVLTFDPHPARVLMPEGAPSTLMTLEQKAEALAGLGVDRMAVMPFTVELSREPPDEFARSVLRGTLQAEVIVVGSNFRFGRGRQGDVGVLAALGDPLGFAVEVAPPVLHQGAPVSSMRIREALARGDVEEARALLGRRFFIDGEVVRGAGRGRQLGVPTANLRPLNETIPASGVYAGRMRPLEGNGKGSWQAVVNVGRRPTFGETTLTVEAHLLDRQADLYGKTLRLEFAARLRDEQAFAGPDALVAQIQRDIAAARRILGQA